MTTFKKKQVIVGIIIMLAIGGGVAAARKFLLPPEVVYITTSATRIDLEESVIATGILKAYKSLSVGAQVNGQLKTLHVALGDKVKKGQLLAEIDPVLPKNTLKDAEAQVEYLKAQKLSKQTLLKQYELAFQRQSQMNVRDAGSRADLESAQAQFNGTQHDISALDAQIKKAIIAVDTAGANLGYTRIHAPIDGTVISIDTEEGQTVVSNQSAPTILTLATLDTMTVKVKISEADVLKVKPGQTAYFSLLGDSDTRYYGKLRAIEPGPVASGTTTSSSSSAAIYYYGLFEVPNPENRLKVSMTAQVVIVLHRAPQSLCIPVSALEKNKKDGTSFVRVLERDKPVVRKIRTGITNGVQVQVLDGLHDGEKIIIGDSSTIPKTKDNTLLPAPGRR